MPFKRERERLFANQKILFKNVKKIIFSHPYFVIIILHEYFRNLFPHDDYIKFRVVNPIKRILTIQNLLINTIYSINKFGYYKLDLKKNPDFRNIKKDTGKVYAQFWKKFSKKENYKAKNFILERFKNFKFFKKNFFFKKKIIDVGCGGGRYSNALRLLKAKSVVGIDYSSDAINLAKKNYKFKNLTFKKQNVLNINYKKNHFDIVHCNGVLHHTTNLEKGIREIIRICKPNGFIYLYLYGRGGLYWSARKQMNTLLKTIPQNYSQKILDNIGMPTNRFIFMDNWYVPIEKHSSYHEIVKILKSCNVRHLEKLNIGRKTDLETGLKKFKNSKIIWGEGEIRLLIQK